MEETNRATALNRAERPSVASAPSVSGLEIHVVVRELESLVGSYVSNIHGLGEAQLFRLKKAGGESEREQEVDLIVSPRYGAWVTRNPGYTATAEFTTALRGELLRRKLDSVSQCGFDRVIIFRFSGKEDRVRLVLELIPPGNLIVTDSDDRIILALRESRGGSRSIARGRLYAPPPQTRGSIDKLDEKSLMESFAKEKTAGKALGRGISLPRKYVDEILARAALQQDDPASGVSPGKVTEIVAIVRELIASLDSPSPALVERNGAIELMSVSPAPGATVVERGETMSDLMDEVFTPRLVDQEEHQKDVVGNDGQENQKARELEVTLQRLGEQVAELRNRGAKMRELANAVRTASSPEEARALMAEARVEGEGETRQLEEESNASIASRLYDEAKRSEAEATRIREAEMRMTVRLEKERSRSHVPTSRVKLVKRDKKEWYEKFRWFFTTGGRLAIGGRDAQSNSLLLKKHTDDRDVVYHADLFGSPFFVLKDGNGKQTDAEVRQLGQATAAFSSAWKTGLAAADAYWVDPGQVSSSAPSGEYLAKGSFVIKGNKNFVNRNPVEVSVGVDGKGTVIAGPEEAMIRLSRAHITLIPHREKASDTAKKVLFELRRYFPRELEGTSVDDVLRVLPAGGGKVVRRRENWKNLSEKGGPDQRENEAAPGP
jgi:predicted ribosome quality control (RQC) complex YloA/Tae2 family protein